LLNSGLYSSGLDTGRVVVAFHEHSGSLYICTRGYNGYDSKKRWDAGEGRERRSCDRLTFFLSRIPSKTINLFYDNWQKVTHLASLISWPFLFTCLSASTCMSITGFNAHMKIQKSVSHKNLTQSPRSGLECRLLDPESNKLLMRAPHLHRPCIRGLHIQNSCHELRDVLSHLFIL